MFVIVQALASSDPRDDIRACEASGTARRGAQVREASGDDSVRAGGAGLRGGSQRLPRPLRGDGWRGQFRRQLPRPSGMLTLHTI